MKLIDRRGLLMLVIVAAACGTRNGDVASTSQEQSVTATQATVAPVTETMSTAPITTTLATAAPSVTSALETDSVRRISVDDALRAVETGTAVLVDVRTEDQYRLGHARGAILVPEAQIVERMGDLPRNKTIITYCA